MTWAKLFVPVVVGAALAWFARGAIASPDPGADLRAERLVETLTDSGYVVLDADAHADLLKREQRTAWMLERSRDSVDALRAARADLARELETMGAELRAVTDVEVSAKSEFQLPDDLTMSDATLALTDTAAASFDDGIFSGRVQFAPRKREFRLSVAARIRASLAWTELPDQRVSVVAVPEDPRVTLALSNASYQLERRSVLDCGFWCQRKHELYGAGVVAILAIISGG